MIVLGRIDWFGDKKAKMQGRDGDYGYVTSLDSEITGSFKLFKNQIRGSYFEPKETEDNDTDEYDKYKDDPYSGALVIFTPATNGKKPKALNLYSIYDYFNKPAIIEAFGRVETESVLYPTVIELIKSSDQPLDMKISLLNHCFYEPKPFINRLLPFIMQDDNLKIDERIALQLLGYALFFNSDEKIWETLIALVKENIDTLKDNFSELTYTESKVAIRFMPDDFLLKHPDMRYCGTIRQQKVLKEYEQEQQKERERIENIKKLKETAERRGIRFFVHFTNVENLESILQHGLLTRQALKDNGFTFYFTDLGRFDRVLDSISLSVTFPNYKMLYMKKQLYSDAKWCVLLIKAEDVLDKPCFFNQTNAASKGVHKDSTAEAFEDMFADKVGQYDRSKLVSCGYSNGDNFATDPQAEVLCCSSIPVESIYGCTFDDPNLLEQYREKLEEAGIKPKYYVWYKPKSCYANYAAAPKKDDATSAAPSVDDAPVLPQ